MSGSPASVFVIDDDPSVREAIGSLLRSVGRQAELFGSVKEFVSRGNPRSPGCLVLDVRLPGQSGLEFQDELARTRIHLPVIFITAHGDIQMSVRAMKAGAIEFLTKPFRDQDLLDAIQIAIERDQARMAAYAVRADLRRRWEELTEREREVMQRVVSGLTNKQIAADLGIVEITVKVHRGQVMRKMGARSVAELVRMADRLEVAQEGTRAILY
jgi:FixJ family two-component response regulator